VSLFNFAAKAPTNAQILRAQASAVGKGRKKCTKGKNCSATCIGSGKICLVELSASISSATKQVVSLVQNKGKSKSDTPAPSAKAPTAAAAPTPKAPAAKAPAEKTKVPAVKKTATVKGNPEENPKSVEAAKAAPVKKTAAPKSTPEEKPKPKAANPYNMTPSQQKLWEGFQKNVLSGEYAETANVKWNSTSKYNQYLAEGKTAAAKQVKTLAGIKRLSDDLEIVAEGKYSNIKSMPVYVQRMVAQMGPKEATQAMKDIQEYTRNDYSNIRGAQTGKADPAVIAKFKPTADRIEKSLEYLPKPAVPKYRGLAVSDENLKKYIDLARTKGEFVSNSMNSWSTAPTTAREFASSDAKDRPHEIIFRTINKKGTPIQALSEIKYEDELLTGANAKYKVFKHSIETNSEGDKYHIFDMTES